MSYPQICQTCFYSGGMAPAEQYPEYTKPLFCRKPETITEKIWPYVWPVVESTFTCLNWRPQLTLIYHVTGTLAPDITGDFIEMGLVDWHKFLCRTDKGYYLWFDDEHNIWTLTRPVPTCAPVAHWERVSEQMLGDYQPKQHASGIATLAAGPG